MMRFYDECYIRGHIYGIAIWREEKKRIETGEGENKCRNVRRKINGLKVARGLLLQIGISKIKKRKGENVRKIMRTRAYGREWRVNEILARLAVLSRYV